MLVHRFSWLLVLGFKHSRRLERTTGVVLVGSLVVLGSPRRPWHSTFKMAPPCQAGINVRGHVVGKVFDAGFVVAKHGDPTNDVLFLQQRVVGPFGVG